MTGTSTATDRLALAAANRFYRGLAGPEDASGLLDSLHPDFVLTLSPGLPVPAARVHHGRDAAVANVWGQLPAGLGLRCEPDHTFVVGADQVIAIGHYRGEGWVAPFAHVLTIKDGTVASLRQITDTRCWPDLATGSGRAPDAGD